LDDKILEELLETEEEKKKRQQDWVLVFSVPVPFFFCSWFKLIQEFFQEKSLWFSYY
jgi:hypothetical protein